MARILFGLGLLYIFVVVSRTQDISGAVNSASATVRDISSTASDAVSNTAFNAVSGTVGFVEDVLIQPSDVNEAVGGLLTTTNKTTTDLGTAVQRLGNDLTSGLMSIFAKLTQSG
ncbi:uncharacterized protein LOC124355947 [Homalodisca vitripennis]|uniref:uncharacterized protein LOC124355947 n=1 Tax=Homalodisca vitripennis TaxID=197043 RepID=UPI001EEBA334|nr:uncharacterized protein LOC124355947 [Homalodisca vitripennis]